MENDFSYLFSKLRSLEREKMAFLCPSQLTVKKKVLHGKSPLPPDSYAVNGKTENHSPVEYKSALKSPSSSTDSSNKTGSQQRTVRIRETASKHQTLIERKLKAANSRKPANIRVKVVHDFKSDDEEELNVCKGQYVKILYQKHDWVYVKDSTGQQGFIPYIYCSTVHASTDSKSSTSGYEESFEESDEVEHRGVDRKSNGRSKKSNKYQHKSRTSNDSTPTMYFPKRPYGPQMTVLYNYKARYENDLRVVRGESVMLLNDQDPEWLWVATEDGEEGFIPRTFVISHTCEGCRKKILREPADSPCINRDAAKNVSETTPTSSSSIDKKSKESSFTDPNSSSSSANKKYSLRVSKLIALYDFEGKAFDDLSVVAGEYVYANLKDQIVPHWIWAYSPYRKRSGFIPEEYLKEPVITDI